MTLQLYQQLSPQFHAYFPERDLILAWLKQDRNGDNSCNELAVRLKDDQHLTDLYLASFIVYDLSGDAISFDKVLFYSYKPLALSIAIKFILFGLRDDYALHLCLELRMFAIKQRKDMPRLLPIIQAKMLAELKDEIRTVKSSLQKSTQSTFCNQLDHYIRPLELLVSGKNEVLNKRVQKREKGLYRLENRVDSTVDTEGNLVIDVYEKFKKSRKTLQSQHEEQDTTPADIKLMLVDLVNKTKEPRANHLIAKGFTHRLILRKKKFPTQLDHLGEYICQYLIDYCHNNIQEDACQLLLLICLTGQSAEELSKAAFIKRKGRLFITRQHRLPTFNQPDSFLPFLPDVSRVFKLPLPREITLCDSKSILKAIEPAELILSSINKKYKGNLTLERLRLNLRSKLIAKNIDSAIVGILCGDQLHQTPALSYTLLNLEEALDVYKHYVNEHISTLYANSLTLEKSGFIGSNLSVKDEVISLQLNRIKQAYTQSLDIPKKQYFLAVYTYYIVALFSAYRPVTAMLGYFNDINFITGMYSISDKENRAGISTRNITLPDIAMQQIKIYRVFMQEIINEYHCIFPDLAQRCRDALSVKNPSPWLFFTLDNEIEEANPKEMASILRKFFPMADNWHRHWARSKLLSFKTPRDVADGWIGHADIEEEGFGRYSGLSLQDMNNVAEQFNQWALDNKVTVING